MFRTFIRLAPVFIMVMFLGGCMTTRNGSKADNALATQEILQKKTVAILPVKAQASLTTDSQTPLKKALNKRLNGQIRAAFPQATIIDTQASSEILNDSDKADVLEKLLSGYENTGGFDKKLVNSLCSTLKADYLLLSKLKVERMDAVIAKTFISSLEVIILGKNNIEPVWSGIGDFKRYGAYGLGGTETNEAADELVTLAFGKEGK